MCRLLFYEGTPILLDDLLFAPKNSLIQQSVHAQEREEPLNGDGFGVAWYNTALNPSPGLFRSVTPAWSNDNLYRLGRVTQSTCVLAHVRAASLGLPVYEGNCHPFVHNELTLMHNGDVAGFRAARRNILGALSDRAFAVIGGSTDSEALFALFLDAFWAREAQADVAERMAAALVTALQQMVALATPFAGDDPSYFNVVVSDGKHAVACRATTGPEKYAESLHVHTGGLFRVVNGVCRMVRPEKGMGANIICSEKLSDDPGWKTVPPNTLVLARGDRQLHLSPLPSLRGNQAGAAAGGRAD